MILVFSDLARKQFKKLDREIQRRVKKYLLEVENLIDPRLRGKGLTSNLSGLWRYRIGSVRVVCKIQDEKIIISILSISFRNESYDL